MIMCICRNINDRKVAEAHKNGARVWHQVHKQCGTKPQCGTCRIAIQQQLDALTNQKAED